MQLKALGRLLSSSSFSVAKSQTGKLKSRLKIKRKGKYARIMYYGQTTFTLKNTHFEK